MKKNVIFPNAKNYVLKYLCDTCDEKTFQSLFKLMEKMPVLDVNSFCVFVENIIEQMEDARAKKILKSRLLNISVEYMVMEEKGTDQ